MERVWTRIYPERTQVQGNTRRGQAARKNDENREVSGTLTRATSATCNTRCSPGPVAAGSREMEVGSKRSLRTRSPSGRRRSQCRKTGAVLQRARLPRAFRPGSNSQLPHKATLINFRPLRPFFGSSPTIHHKNIPLFFHVSQQGTLLAGIRCCTSTLELNSSRTRPVC